MHYHGAISQTDYAAILVTALILGILFVMLRESGKPSDYGRTHDPNLRPQWSFYNSGLPPSKWALLWVIVVFLVAIAAHKLGVF